VRFAVLPARLLIGFDRSTLSVMEIEPPRGHAGGVDFCFSADGWPLAGPLGAVGRV
jgi:hypothetical protein